RAPAGVRQHEDALARPAQPYQRVPHAGIDAAAVMQHAPLIEQDMVETFGDGREPLDIIRRPGLHQAHAGAPPLSASRAVPWAAPVSSARSTGTPSARARIRVQAGLRAPPPTVSTRLSSGAPSSARRR